jgi:hypothetical protein
MHQTSLTPFIHACPWPLVKSRILPAVEWRTQRGGD